MSDPVVKIDSETFVPQYRLSNAQLDRDRAQEKCRRLEADLTAAREELARELMSSKYVRLGAATAELERLREELAKVTAKLERCRGEWRKQERGMIADAERHGREIAELREELAKVTAARDEWKAGCNVRDGQLAKLDAALGVPTHTSWSELAEAGEKLRSDLTQARAESARLTREVEAMRERYGELEGAALNWLTFMSVNYEPRGQAEERLLIAIRALSKLQSPPAKGCPERCCTRENGHDGDHRSGTGRWSQSMPGSGGTGTVSVGADGVPTAAQPPERAPDALDQCKRHLKLAAANDPPSDSLDAIMWLGIHANDLESRLSKLEHVATREVEARPDEASPLPWRVGDPDADASEQVMAANGTLVGRFLMRRDAAFIVACANRARGE